MAKKSILDFQKMKKEKHKVVLLSVPDATTANLAERAGVDIVCLGDSLGMVLLGYSSTIPVTMDDMIRHGQAVRRGAPNTFLLACMPYQSYRNPEIALENATRYIQEVGADSIKVQGGKNVQHIIEVLSKAGIPCMGHVGLVPHNIPQLGGFKVQAKTAEGALAVYEDALAIQEAGGIGVEIEAVPPEIAEQITNDLEIFTYGIGAGPWCDGQILIAWDMLGFFDAFKPKFVKRYADLANISIEAIKVFSHEVREGKFPTEEHCYKMIEGEAEKLSEILKLD